MFDGKRMAMLFWIGGHARVVCGRIKSDADPDLGPVLRVELDQDGCDLAGQTTLVFREESLQGRLYADDRHGCDFCVDLDRMMTQGEGRRREDPGEFARNRVAAV